MKSGKASSFFVCSVAYAVKSWLLVGGKTDWHSPGRIKINRKRKNFENFSSRNIFRNMKLKTVLKFHHFRANRNQNLHHLILGSSNDRPPLHLIRHTDRRSRGFYFKLSKCETGILSPHKKPRRSYHSRIHPFNLPPFCKFWIFLRKCEIEQNSTKPILFLFIP